MLIRFNKKEFSKFLNKDNVNKISIVKEEQPIYDSEKEKCYYTLYIDKIMFYWYARPEASIYNYADYFNFLWEWRVKYGC